MKSIKLKSDFIVLFQVFQLLFLSINSPPPTTATATATATADVELEYELKIFVFGSCVYEYRGIFLVEISMI